MSCKICLSLADHIAAPRHVGSWNDLTASEQFGLLARLGEALSVGAKGFAASDEHGHFHLRLTTVTASRLTTGGADPLLPLITHDIDKAEQVDLAVAFAMTSGVVLIEPWLRDLLARGGRLRVVVGDYMDVTEPAALRRLSDLEGADLYVHQTGRGSFHPKAWLFRAADRSGAAIVGSSNLSETALTSGIEWNLHSEDAADAVETAFTELLKHPQTLPLTDEWITSYAERRRQTPLPVSTQLLLAAESRIPIPEPHEIQRAALKALADTREHGMFRGLVVLATGLGKTWLAAFDSQPFARVLFVAHREEILTQAMASFRRIRPEARFGRYDGSEKTEDTELIFASIQTLGAAHHLRRFAPDAFDDIVVDEFHPAAASSNRSFLDHFTPRSLLGACRARKRKGSLKTLVRVARTGRGYQPPFPFRGLWPQRGHRFAADGRDIVPWLTVEVGSNAAFTAVRKFSRFFRITWIRAARSDGSEFMI